MRIFKSTLQSDLYVVNVRALTLRMGFRGGEEGTAQAGVAKVYVPAIFRAEDAGGAVSEGGDMRAGSGAVGTSQASQTSQTSVQTLQSSVDAAGSWRAAAQGGLGFRV